MPFPWALIFTLLIFLSPNLGATDQFFQSKGSWTAISEKEGIKKCEEGKIKEAELIFKKAIKIISFTRLK